VRCKYKHGVFTSLPSDVPSFFERFRGKSRSRLGIEIFREISRKNEVVTGQGGKNPGFLSLVGISNEANGIVNYMLKKKIMMMKKKQ
jgi:hypothetical protein